jgi:hypothetical protein
MRKPDSAYSTANRSHAPRSAVPVTAADMALPCRQPVSPRSTPLYAAEADICSREAMRNIRPAYCADRRILYSISIRPALAADAAPFVHLTTDRSQI